MQNKDFKSVRSFMNRFPNETACRKYLENKRWPQGDKSCPHCKSIRKIYTYKDGITYKCADCKKQFSLTKGTIFEKTKIPLADWFYIIYKFVTQRKGLSSYEVSRQIGITQPNALYMLHRIYKACGNTGEREMLEGIVEIDETFVGGKNRFRHYNKRKKGIQGRSTVDKVPIIGMLARGGNIRLLKVSRLEKKPMQTLIRNMIKHDSVVATDEYLNYNGLNKWFHHGQCNHGAYQYVNSIFHTNTLEGAWGLFKRSIIGVHHQISRRLMRLYCNAFEFRYNHRKFETKDSFEILLSQCFG